MTELKTLPEDIYNLFDPNVDHIINEDNLERFCNNVKEQLRSRLKANSVENENRSIRFSGLGRCDRQIYYDTHPDEAVPKEPIRPKDYLKFTYGAIIEELVLLLAREAGHEVTHEQAGVEIDGVTGSMDAKIDGVVVDVKSASPYGFKKFEDGSILQNDSFGYVEQLSGYSSIENPGEDAAWVAFDKVSGEICVAPLSAMVIKHHLPEPRIKQLKEMVAKDTPPERCYTDVEDGKSGNRKLQTECSYCPHKFRCWPGLRKFIYSNGPRYLTEVRRVPDVFEETL